jgi:uncharacterized tellurite resistance protein B-like protein
MTPQLTINEKFAIVSILSKIMKADGIIHPKEEEYLDGIYKAFGVTINDLEDIANMDDIHAKHCIEKMSIENKEYVRTLFVDMAKCDGYVHPKEMEIISSIFDAMDNYQKFIVPIYEKKLRQGKEKESVIVSQIGNGFFIEGLFVTAAHVIEESENGECYIKVGGDEKELCSDRAVIYRKVADDDEYRDLNIGDVAVFRFDGVKSPLKLNTTLPVKGDTLTSCYYYQSAWHHAIGLVGDDDWFMGNFFGWQTAANTIHPTEGGSSGSPLLKDNIVYGILHAGNEEDPSICVFTAASFVKKLLQAQSL